MDIIDSFNYDIITYIMNYLDYKDLSRLECTCKIFQIYAKEIKKCKVSLILDKSPIFRHCIHTNNIKLIEQILRNQNICDRKSTIIECTILSIYHKNQFILEKLLLNFRLFIKDNIYYIKSASVPNKKINLLIEKYLNN